MPEATPSLPNAPKLHRKRLVDVIKEVFEELGATSPNAVHRSEFCPIIARRWKELGHAIGPNFDQHVSAELHRWCAESARWRRFNLGEYVSALDLFEMHGEGYWSLKPPVSLADLL
jgi:hypothetical protein